MPATVPPPQLQQPQTTPDIVKCPLEAEAPAEYHCARGAAGINCSNLIRGEETMANDSVPSLSSGLFLLNRAAV